MNKPLRTTLQIRRADEEIYKKVAQFNFSGFISEMLSRYGQLYIDARVQELTKIAK